MVTIENNKAAGKFASGFKYTVLECIDKDGGVVIQYASPVWKGDYNPRKQNACEMSVDDGVIYSGYAKHDFEWLGDCEEMVRNANWIKGRTYDIKEELKEMGFAWNREEGQYERVVPLPEDVVEVDPWAISGLSPEDDTCEDLDDEYQVPKDAKFGGIAGACESILERINQSSLGNWQLYSNYEGKCQLINKQTGWFLNASYYRGIYNVKVGRTKYNGYSESQFDNMWKPLFMGESEYEGFKQVAKCNGRKTLRKFRDVLLEGMSGE
jgi:hypothetical protein